MTDPITTQLRSLEAEYRAKADYFKVAADLQDDGYKSDQSVIDQKVSECIDATVAPLNQKIIDLTQQLTDKDAQIATLTQQLNDAQIP